MTPTIAPHTSRATFAIGDERTARRVIDLLNESLDDGQAAMAALAKIKDEVGYDSLLYDDQIGKVSLIGAGMRSHPGITARFFAALASAGVNIEMISTSEIRISVIVDEAQVDAAVQATHSAFDLDANEVEAVVYGGTGR